MKKLMLRWNIDTPKDLIIIFFVFSITGSSSVLIGRPILKFLGITLEHIHPIIYYPLFIISSFIFYQIFLVIYGWVFGQFSFFWNMEKKMLKRFGITI
ncbi:Diacylglyceryl transferase [Tenacibaculum sp. 190130A14a]|uniref:Diacylglyceryl transferase n=1 Tax=Tenacibaculum polynesiense TaxID=3137857 RepID=A0ABM9PFZ6_9FLAO